MTYLISDSNSEYLQWIAYLRHELYTPLNAINGYSELLIEDLENTGSVPREFTLLLEQCNQLGVKVFHCINHYMSGDSLFSAAEQVDVEVSKVDIDAECYPTAIEKSWRLITQVVLLQHLQPMAVGLQQLSKQLTELAPSQFSDDISKIAIATSNFQALIALVLQSQTWPCELQLQGQHEEKDRLAQESSGSFQATATLAIGQAGADNSGHSRVLTRLEPSRVPINQSTRAESDTRLAAKPAKAMAAAMEVADNPPSINKLVKPTANILIVDDNGANRDLLCRYIARQSHQAFPVSSGLEAIRQIETGIYDLVLLDILMPEIDGYEVLEWIHRSQWRHLSVIMISSLDELDSVVKCIEMGAEDYLPKPFNPVLLKARVDACLEKKKMRDQEVEYLEKLAVANEEITHLNAQLREENVRLSAELDISRRIQQMMLPRAKELAEIDDLDLVGFMKPADEVGGDYYDVIHQNNGVIIGIGDVTGHGLESGLLMLMIQTAVRTLVEQGCCDYREFLDVVNRTILSNTARMETSRSSTLLLIHYHAGKLSISGQHEEVIIIRSNGLIEYVDTINLGFPVGLDDDIYDFLGKTEVKLNLQDIAILYTDGITEAEDFQGQFYGIKRLSQVAAQNRLSSASVIRDAVIHDLTQHIGDYKVFDDITLVVMKRNA